MNKQTLQAMTRSAAVPRDFVVGEGVMVRDYRAQYDKWQPAIIRKRLGPLSYQVTINGGTAVWLRHADQIRRSSFKASQEEEEDDITESEVNSGRDGQGPTIQQRGEEVHKEVQHQGSASPAHTEAETNVHTEAEINVGITPIPKPTATVTTGHEKPCSSCDPPGVASRANADMPKVPVVVTSRSGRVINKPKRYMN